MHAGTHIRKADMEKDMEKGNKMELDRRDFLKGAAFVGGATAAGIATVGMIGCSPDSNNGGGSGNGSGGGNDSKTEGPAVDINIVGTYTADFVVVGAGYSGLAAANQAAEEGLGVVVLEQFGYAGGLASGIEGLFSLGSTPQKEQGFEVEPVEFVSLEMNYSHNRANGVKWMDLAHNSGEDVDWLLTKGVQIPEITRSQVFYSSDRVHSCYTPFMAKSAEDAGVRFLYNTTAVSLVLSNGTITGVIGKKSNGDGIQINASAVLLACGGYAENPEYLRESGFFRAEDVVTFLIGHNGDGITLARQAGAADILYKATALQQPTLKGAPGGEYGTFGNANAAVVCTRSANTLWVNETGDRICNENSGGENWMALMIPMLQHKQVFSIYDQTTFESNFYGGPSAYDRTTSWQYDDDASLAQFEEQFDINPDACIKANSIEELVNKAASTFSEIDQETLLATITRYNENCKAGKDNDFGKEPEFMKEFTTGPFYMIYMPPSVMVTYGALVVNRKCEVCDEKRDPILGLYASGNDAADLWPNIYTINVQCGTSANHIYTGRTAARSAAAYIGNAKTGTIAEDGDTSLSIVETNYSQPASLKDGTYTSTDYMGMFGMVNATVTISGGKITEINSVHEMETPYVGAYAIDDIIKEVIDGQNVNVDTVGGATASSAAICKSIEDALNQAG
jgi:fumarate reductase flavoprotein subunit